MKTVGTYKSQSELVAGLTGNLVLRNGSAISAMLAVDRKNYCVQTPYDDAPKPTILGQTISAPHMHAQALEELAPCILVRDNVSHEINPLYNCK